MTQHQAEQATGLKGRVVENENLRPNAVAAWKLDGYSVRLGDGIRCQLGETKAEQISFTVRDAQGTDHYSMTQDYFIVRAVGPDWTTAAANLITPKP